MFEEDKHANIFAYKKFSLPKKKKKNQTNVGVTCYTLCTIKCFFTGKLHKCWFLNCCKIFINNMHKHISYIQ